jgi:transcriptional regulator with XRE-family HTH domain
MSSVICLFYERLFYERFVLKYNQKVSVIMMFKERLKKLRLGKGMTQEQLADKLGLPHSTIRRYESMDRGYPKEERLQQLADFFKCTVDYLLGREENEYEQNKTNFIIDGLVKKYDIDLSIEGERDKLEQLIKLYADLRKP